MVSVIIPTYNRANVLTRSVMSVLNQTYRDLELIIVDDCSTDDTEQVVGNITDERIRYIKQEKNQGACVARNTGIRLAKGEYIAFQDSDDSWQSDKLQLQIQKMQEYRAAICYGRRHRHGFPKSQPEYVPDLETGVIPYEKLIAHFGVSTQTIVARSEVFADCLFDVNVRRMQDFDWMVRAAEHNKVVFVREAVVDTYLQADSISKKGCQNLINANEFLLEKYADRLERYPDFHVALLESIGFNKTLTGQNAGKEYWAVYKIRKTGRAWMRWLCAKTGLLKVMWRNKVLDVPVVAEEGA